MGDGPDVLRFASYELGLDLTSAQSEMVSTFVGGEYSQAVWQCGRRGGKSLLADVLALYDAVVRGHLSTKLRQGERRVAGIVTPRLDQAEAHIRSIAALAAHSPYLRSMVAEQRSDEIVFANGAAIQAVPCSARSLRGAAWSTAILDEFGHFVTLDASNAAGDRVLEAVQPALAQFGNDSWLIAISTPLWKQGAFWRLVQRARSGRFNDMHYRHYSTGQMNPHIPAEWLERRRREDPDLYAREFMAEFVDGTSSYLPAADVTACIRGGEKASPPRLGAAYRVAIDPGYQQDSFALGIAHNHDGTTCVDSVLTWRRAGHEAVLDHIAETCRAYRVSQVTTDQGGGVRPVLEGLQRRGLTVRYAPWSNESKMRAFSALKIGLNTRTVSLPDDPALVEELCGLEARPTPNGMTRIAAVSGGHDDRAVVVAAVVAELTVGQRETRERLQAVQGLNEQLKATARRVGLAGLGVTGPLPR